MIKGRCNLLFNQTFFVSTPEYHNKKGLSFNGQVWSPNESLQAKTLEEVYNIAHKYGAILIVTEKHEDMETKTIRHLINWLHIESVSYFVNPKEIGG